MLDDAIDGPGRTAKKNFRAGVVAAQMDTMIRLRVSAPSSIDGLPVPGVRDMTCGMRLCTHAGGRRKASGGGGVRVWGLCEDVGEVDFLEQCVWCWRQLRYVWQTPESEALASAEWCAASARIKARS
tara:strand:+ start:500 stop:880 length:381 start_codon:yes stop_codon:yes gene_type:complete